MQSGVQSGVLWCSLSMPLPWVWGSPSDQNCGASPSVLVGVAPVLEHGHHHCSREAGGEGERAWVGPGLRTKRASQRTLPCPPAVQHCLLSNHPMSAALPHPPLRLPPSLPLSCPPPSHAPEMKSSVRTMVAVTGFLASVSCRVLYVRLATASSLRAGGQAGRKHNTGRRRSSTGQGRRV